MSVTGPSAPLTRPLVRLTGSLPSPYEALLNSLIVGHSPRIVIAPVCWVLLRI